MNHSFIKKNIVKSIFKQKKVSKTHKIGLEIEKSNVTFLLKSQFGREKTTKQKQNRKNTSWSFGKNKKTQISNARLLKYMN